jgi:hypothetical protein
VAVEGTVQTAAVRHAAVVALRGLLVFQGHVLAPRQHLAALLAIVRRI